MRNKAQLISIKFFKKYNGIDDNVNDSIVKSTILKTQTLWLEDMLSASLYFDLMNKIDNDTLNTDEEYLLREYVAPTLAEYTYYEYTLTSTYQNKAIGLVQPSSENSENLDYKTIRNMRYDLKNRAEKVGSRLVNYLTNNSNLFDKYNSGDEDDSNTVDDTYFSGIHIPN